jgi:hypothetical protein
MLVQKHTAIYNRELSPMEKPRWVIQTPIGPPSKPGQEGEHHHLTLHRTLWFTEPPATNRSGKLFPVALWTKRTDATSFKTSVWCPAPTYLTWPEDLNSHETKLWGTEADLAQGYSPIRRRRTLRRDSQLAEWRTSWLRHYSASGTNHVIVVHLFFN